jgi:CDP-6-deoxy-D-xylo-4-hexulose-3-dehydrase
MQMRSLIENFISDARGIDNDLFPFIANKKDFNPEKDSIYYSGPYWDDREIIEIIQCIMKGKWLASGEKVRTFEREFSHKFNFNSSLMVNSGSSANLVMIAALKKYFNWDDGDEIIVCVCGFPTSIAPIIQNGLKPIFVDINWNDLNWNLDELESKITDRTVALMSSPVLGNPYDFDRIIDISNKYSIELISDNCDSLGSKWRDKYLTDYSVASSCSFYPAHHLCTIEGGMVSSNDEYIVDLARSFAWWGRDCTCVGTQNLLACGSCGKRFDNWLRDHDGIVDHKYVFSNIGYNLKPADLQGAIGSVQLSKFTEIHETRRNNKELIEYMFRGMDGIRIPIEIEHAEASWFGVPVICDNERLKNRLVKHLELNRVQTRNYFAGNILVHPGYSHLDDFRRYPESNKVLDRVFFLGCSPLLTDDMFEYLGNVLSSFKQ